MKIAFDCKGTLMDGQYVRRVLELFRALQNTGHEVYIWSSEFSYTLTAAKRHGITLPDDRFLSKYSLVDAAQQGLPVMDIAIDDDKLYSNYLAAKKFVYVDTIPETIDEIITFAALITKTV